MSQFVFHWFPIFFFARSRLFRISLSTFFRFLYYWLLSRICAVKLLEEEEEKGRRTTRDEKKNGKLSPSLVNFISKWTFNIQCARFLPNVISLYWNLLYRNFPLFIPSKKIFTFQWWIEEQINKKKYRKSGANAKF